MASGTWFGETPRQRQAKVVKQQHTGISPNHVPEAVPYFNKQENEAPTELKLGLRYSTKFPVRILPFVLHSGCGNFDHASLRTCNKIGTPMWNSAPVASGNASAPRRYRSIRKFREGGISGAAVAMAPATKQIGFSTTHFLSYPKGPITDKWLGWQRTNS